MALKVLCLCIGNRARSQLAHALLRHYAAQRASEGGGAALLEVFSAGLRPRVLGPEGVHPLVHEVLAEIGVSSAGLYSKTIDEVRPCGPFDYVISVCAEAEEECPVLPGMGQHLRWALPDPVEFPQDEYPRVFREMRDALADRVKGFLAGLAISAPVPE